MPYKDQETKRAYQLSHKKEIAEYRRRYNKAHRLEQLVAFRRYYRKNKRARWAYELKRRYGTTLAEYERMFELQAGVCAICKKPPNGRRLDIDHSHETGAIRGLLCTTCNRAVGAFESLVRKEGGQEYLEGVLTT